MGITISSRTYDLESATPFQLEDILDLTPVVKHSIPTCSEATDMMRTGKALLAKGILGEAYTQFSKALCLLQQVTGPLHSDVANCCRHLAIILYHAGDVAGAIVQQHKELIINERCLGFDHPDTAHSYGNLALFYHGLNQTSLALKHMFHAVHLLKVISGINHPDVATTFINVAMMFQDIGKMNKALRYLQEALKKNEMLLGKEHVQTAVCYHALAIAFNSMGLYKRACEHEKQTYDIFAKHLGKDDSRTHDSQMWLKIFKIRELQKSKAQAQDMASTQTVADLLKAHPELIALIQSSAANPPEGADRTSTGQLLFHPLAAPIHAQTPLAQLLSILSSGTQQGGGPHVTENKKEGGAEPSSTADKTKNGGSAKPTPTPAAAAPAIESKKQRRKSKAKS